MRYEHSDTYLPPRSNEAVDAVVSRLVANPAILVQLGGANVYAHEAPADKPPSGKWIVVRERQEMGGDIETMSGLVSPLVLVMTECRRGVLSGAAARTWHATTHDLVAADILEQTITVTTGVASMPRRELRPSSAMPDADDDTTYSTAGYRVTLSAEVAS